MRNNATIELIGYVYGEIESPMSDKYPNWVKFSLSVTKKWKDRSGEEKKEISWFRCNSWSEGLSNIIKNNVKGGMGVLVKGFPKANAYIDKEGVAKSQIEVKVSEMNILTYPKSEEGKSHIESRPVADDVDLYDDIPF